MTVSQFTANCRGVTFSAKSQSALVARSLKDGVPVLPPTKTIAIGFPILLHWHRLIELNYRQWSQSPLYYHYTKPAWQGRRDSNTCGRFLHRSQSPAPSTARRLPYINLERIAGIEPALSAWQAEVLPLNYIRILGSQHHK